MGPTDCLFEIFIFILNNNPEISSQKMSESGWRCNDQPEGDSAHEIPLVTQNTCIHGSSLVELTPTLLYGGLYSRDAGKWAGFSS